MTENQLEFDRKKFTPTNLNVGTSFLPWHLKCAVDSNIFSLTFELDHIRIQI